jgi:eukaryotic-like serine/threonine-protein kinase
MFVALDQAAGTELLVKVLPTQLSLGVDPMKFEAELASLGARLAHHGLVAPEGGGRAGSFVYHTRRFVQGTTLRAALARHGELPLRRAVEVLHDVLEALAHAHAVGIWHGDLKPENVLLGDGRTLVTDAAVFSAVERSWGGSGGAAPGSGHGAMTTALCTTEYLAPERRAGEARAGSQDDIFAVGVMLHEMLTGHPPAERAEPLESMRSVPAWLGELGRRCRAAEPTERWSDAAAALAGGSWPGGAGGGLAE